MKNCEQCGARPPRIREGEFAGETGMHAYCEHCSEDLCLACMTRMPCDVAADGRHEANLTAEERVEIGD